MKDLYIIYFGPDCEEKILSERVSNIDEYYSISPSVYLLSSEKSATEIYTIIAGGDNKDSEIVVLKISEGDGSYWGFSEKSLWEWLRKNKQNNKDGQV